MKDGNRQYGQDKQRLWDQTRDFDSFVVIGMKGGEPHILSTVDEQQTESLLTNARSPELTG